MAKKKKYVLVEEQDAVQEGRTGGCMKPILICVLILFAVAIIAPNRGSDTKTSTAKAKASATVKPTATPAPTATPVPDFPAMSIEDAAAALSMYYAGSDFEYISVFEFDGAVSINVKLKPFLTARYAVRDCCIFSLNVSRYLFCTPKLKALSSAMMQTERTSTGIAPFPVQSRYCCIATLQRKSIMTAC